MKEKMATMTAKMGSGILQSSVSLGKLDIGILTNRCPHFEERNPSGLQPPTSVFLIVGSDTDLYAPELSFSLPHEEEFQRLTFFTPIFCLFCCNPVPTEDQIHVFIRVTHLFIEGFP